MDLFSFCFPFSFPQDYDRAPEVLKSLDPYEVLVLGSCLQILPQVGHTEDSFKKFVRQRLNL